ncbi:MAG TPA: YkgJ family cysteine cluster protein, partial [Anaerolineales bacterium]|nr:YkgJ family cysteine cluster protein [Anaerolineales bacterium]
MTGIDEVGASQAEVLCKSCGLCCTGHLFTWTKLKSVELAPARSLGLNVFGAEPNQRGFSQPCPLWEGQCAIHATPQYPHACRTYKCKLLKEVIDETTPLANALIIIQQTKGMINDLEMILPVSQKDNFRERLVAQIEYLEGSTQCEKVD